MSEHRRAKLGARDRVPSNRGLLGRHALLEEQSFIFLLILLLRHCTLTDDPLLLHLT
jgi:hypothetical protein